MGRVCVYSVGRRKLATNSVSLVDAVSNLGFGRSSKLRRERWACSGPWQCSLRGCGFGTGWLSSNSGSGPFCSLAFMTWGLAVYTRLAWVLSPALMTDVL